MARACLKGLVTSISQRTVYSVDVIAQSQDLWLAGLLAALVLVISVRQGDSWFASFKAMSAHVCFFLPQAGMEIE